jgi:hypothetical protein|tara:strand:+ start:2321 stop:2494 length:174 start_codon:yes stop_codon:yes gene_type:complete
MGGLGGLKMIADVPDNVIDPPDYWTCEECYCHFYPNPGQEPEENDRVLCYECDNFYE